MLVCCYQDIESNMTKLECKEVFLLSRQDYFTSRISELVLLKKETHLGPSHSVFLHFYSKSVLLAGRWYWNYLLNIMFEIQA